MAVRAVERKRLLQVDNRSIDVASLVAKAFKSQELVKIGDRSYVNAFKYPESRFEAKDLKLATKQFERLISDPLIKPQPYSYMVFQDEDGYIYAKNWRGANQFPGTDASTVIQSAINALTNRGKILIKAGTYILTSSIVLGNNVLQGESRDSTILQMAVGSTDTVIVNVVDYVNGSSEGTEVHDLTVDGNYPTNPQTGSAGMPSEASECGISFRSVTNGVIENCKVINCPWNGIQLYKGCKNVIIEGCYVKNIGFIGIEIWGASAATVNGGGIFNSQVLDCAVSGGGAGIKVEYYIYYYSEVGNFISGSGVGLALGGNDIHSCSFVGNTVYSSANRALYPTYSTGSDNIVSGNTFTRAAGQLCVDIGASVSGLNIIGNSIVGTVTIASGADVKFKNNIGYVTENSVLSPTFAIDSTGIKTVTIPHGLAITPAKKDCALTVVEETDVDDWRYDFLKVDSVDATNVVAKINVSTASVTAGATARLALRVGTP